MSPGLELLLQDVRVGEGLDKDLDRKICQEFFPEIGPCEPHCAGEEPIFWHEPLRKRPPPPLTLRLDASLWLLGQVLPGHDWKIESPNFHVESSLPEYYAVVKDTARSREAYLECREPRWDDDKTRRGYYAKTHYGMTARSPARALLAAVIHTRVQTEKSSG